jgi:hypothetical protein
MIRNQLHDYCGDDPIWGFVAQLGAERFTGEAQVGTSQKVRIYADEGEVYFAEREGDAPLQSRLVTSGALTPAQLARGGIFLDGSVSLANLFVRESTIDHHHVELTVEQLTSAVLAEVGAQPAGTVTLVPLRHHETGIHQWARRLPVPMAPRPPAAPLAAPAAPVVAMPLPDPFAAPAPVDAAPVDAAPVDAAPVVVAPVVVAPVVVAPLPMPLMAPPSADAIAAPLPTPALLETPTAPTVPALPTLAAAPTWTRALEVDAEEGAHDRFSPADFEEMELPKLASRSMSVMEITAAQAALTGDATPEAAPDAFLPTDIPTEGLPHLVGFPTHRDEPVEATVIAEDTAIPEDEVTVIPEDMVITDDEPEPVSDDEQHAFDSAPAASYDPGTSWTPAAQQLAVVEIWDMVDELLHTESEEQTLVSVGAPEPRGGRWRRGKKG